MKRSWMMIYEALLFFAPVLAVISIASLLVYCTFLADITLVAVVIAEEGTGTQAASAGLVNALTFIIPAIIGGFAIALLFKYRKKLTLKYFFGGALFFAGLFITFFFGDSILFLVQSRFYNLNILAFDPMNLKVFDFSLIFTFNGIYLMMIIFCALLSFYITYIISSRKFKIQTKNYALIFQSALMGAFLSVILPTYTVIILLIGLSLYDIYSVRRGPIKDIVRYTLEDESNHIQMTKHPDTNGEGSKTNFYSSTTQTRLNPPTHFGCVVSSKISNENQSSSNYDQQVDGNIDHSKTNKPTSPTSPTSPISPIVPIGSTDSTVQTGPTTPSLTQAPQPNLQPRLTEQQITNYSADESGLITSNQKGDNLYSKFEIESSKIIDDEESILTSMTYSSRDWDIGIGDLVFYSLLASQPLTPYFIFNHGLHLLNTYGLWIFWLISLFTVIGILIGFVITIRLLERNSMLPGLPLSIALGLSGFLGSAFVISLI